MVIVQLSGGLGNQLFQYAAAKSLALTKQTTLKCDIDFFSTQSTRSVGLNFFELDFEVATADEIQMFQPDGILSRITQRVKPPHKRKSYREPFFHFDPNFFLANENVYLKGNWQSEKYFKPFESEIRNDFRIKQTYVRHLSAFAQQLRETHSVSVHIRRGDYLQQGTLAYHGVLSKEYYNNAIAELKRELPNLELYFFSDDIEWVRNNLDLDLPHKFVSGDITKSSIEDFHLMQSCQHNIIANSSFSWWAAWLNQNPKKIIIAPKRWFNQGPKDTYDLLPENWLKL